MYKVTDRSDRTMALWKLLPTSAMKQNILMSKAQQFVERCVITIILPENSQLLSALLQSHEPPTSRAVSEPLLICE